MTSEHPPGPPPQRLKPQYDLSRGHPNRHLLPTAEMREILAEIATSEGSGQSDDDGREEALRFALGYSPLAGTKGLLFELRSFLDRNTAGDDLGGRYVQEEEGVTTTSPPPPLESNNRLFATNGVSHGIELLCRTQTSPGDVVLVDRPTYFLVSGIFANSGLVVRGLPMEPEVPGAVDVGRLTDLVTSGEMEAPRMIYLIPTHHNPTGYTMPPEKRRDLAEFAMRHGVLVVADEVYHLLDWRDRVRDGPRPARMAAYNDVVADRGGSYNDGKGQGESPSGGGRRAGGCASVSSFTKIFAPGVRCGWVEAPDAVIRGLGRCGYLRSQGGSVPITGDLIMRIALRSRRCDAVLQRLNAAYEGRARRMCDVLHEESGIRVVHRPLGGLFIWVKFPDDVDARDLLNFCAGTAASDSASGVRFLPGEACDARFGDGDLTQEERDRNDIVSGVSGASFRSCARLCFADLDEDDLVEGTRRLVRAFGEYMSHSERGSFATSTTRT